MLNLLLVRRDNAKTFFNIEICALNRVDEQTHDFHSQSFFFEEKQFNIRIRMICFYLASS